MNRSYRGRVFCSPISFLVLLLISTLTLGAQMNTSGVTGNVADATGASVPGAQITLTNVATGIHRSTTSDNAGLYNFDYVPIGVYTLTASQNGFQAQRHENVELVAAQTARVDFALNVQSAQQTVTVTSELPLLDSTSSQQTSTLSTKALNQLPVAKQDWTSVLQLGAGISTQGDPNSPAGASLTINGLPPAGFNLTVDGTNATSDPETPAFGFYQGPNIINTINNDAIAEVSVVKGVAPASIGGTMSGNANIITKSGGNAFHGSLYEINDLSAYDARNQFLTSKPRSTFNEFGGSIGGPILTNKLFFFGSYEGARLSSYQAVTGTVPTPYLKSTSPAVYSSLFATYPTVSQPADPTATTVQYSGSGSLRQTDGNGTARLDYNPNSHNLITVRYIRGRPAKLSPNVVLTNPRNTTGKTDAFNASFTHSANRWTALTRFGYNHIRLTRLDEGFFSDVEQVTVAGIDSGGAEEFDKRGDFYTGEQEFAISLGRHSIEIGGIVQRQDAGRTDYNTATIGFGSIAAFRNNTPSLVQLTFDLNPFNIYTYQYGGYVQDDFQVSHTLTVNAGIRYDYYTVPKEDSGRFFNRGVDPARPQLGPGFGAYRPADSLYNADHNNIQPRLGFTWAVGPQQKTVIRGGYGIFVGPHPIFGGPIDEVQDSATEPFRVILSGQQLTDANLHYPLPRSTYQSILSDLQARGVISTQLANAAIKADFPNPYSQQWMLGVQQSLFWNSVLEIDYVGNRGLKENMTEQRNLPDRVTGIAPDPTFSAFRYYYAGDASNYHAMQVSYRKNFAHSLSYTTSYVWSRNMSFADANLLLQNAPQDIDNIRADYGRTPFDIRNKFSGSLLWEPPIIAWTGMTSRPAKLLLDQWRISAVVNGQTGLPVNILNGDSSYPSDRPDPSGTNPYLSNYHSTLQYLNPAGFTQVPLSAASGAQIRGGLLGRDALQQPGSINVDASLGKTFSFTERFRFELRGDAFNVLNHTNLSGLQTNVSSGSFGQLTSATARTIQVSGRFTF